MVFLEINYGDYISLYLGQDLAKIALNAEGLQLRVYQETAVCLHNTRAKHKMYQSKNIWRPLKE